MRILILAGLFMLAVSPFCHANRATGEYTVDQSGVVTFTSKKTIIRNPCKVQVMRPTSEELGNPPPGRYETGFRR